MSTHNKDPGRRGYFSTLAFPILCILIIAPLTYGAYLRNGVYDSWIHLWVDTCKKSPHKVRPFNNVAAEFMNLKMLDQAVPWIERAFYLVQNYPQTSDYHAQEDRAAARGNMATLLAYQGRFVEAVSILRVAEQEYYYSWEIHNNIGLYLAGLGLYDHAIAEVEESIRINPYPELSKKNLERIIEMKKGRSK